MSQHRSVNSLTSPRPNIALAQRLSNTKRLTGSVVGGADVRSPYDLRALQAREPGTVFAVQRIFVVPPLFTYVTS